LGGAYEKKGAPTLYQNKGKPRSETVQGRQIINENPPEEKEGVGFVGGTREGES